jgi:hypothetical protein
LPSAWTAASRWQTAKSFRSEVHRLAALTSRQHL